MSGASAAGYAAADPAASASERDNVRVWDGAKPGRYEVWYLTLSHPGSQTGYWLRYTLEAPLAGHGEPYAQLWFACFDRADATRTFAINQRFPIAAMRAEASPFVLRVGEAELRHGAARGAIAGGGHRVRWDLSWLPAAASLRWLPDVMYRRGGVGDTSVLSPNHDVPVRGEIEVDGRVVRFDGEPGGQTHIWGRKHAHAWAWSHCNAFEGRRGAALETLTVQLQRRGRVLPALTLVCLDVDGESHRLNQFRHVLRNRGSWEVGRYTFSAVGARVRIEGEYTCRPEQMIEAEYADPDGAPSWCANTEIADLRVTVWKRDAFWSGWREHAKLLAPGTGHFEVAGRARHPGVVKQHVTVG